MMDFDYDYDYDSLQDEIALEGRQEWDREAEYDRQEAEYEDDWTEADEIEARERWDAQMDEFFF